MLGDGPGHRVRFVPALDFNGTVTEALVFRPWDRADGTASGRDADITDVGGATAYSVVTEVVSITVRPVSDAPTLSDIPDQRTMMGRPWGPLDFTIGDVDTLVANLSLSAVSSDAVLVPVENIGFGGSGISRTVVVTPTACLLESATFMITVDDGSTAISDAYVLTVWAPAYLPLVVREF